MDQIILQPIGIIHSPYKQAKDIPIQGRFKDDVEAWVELKKEFVEGLMDLDQFSHCFLIFYLHKSDKVNIQGTPYLEDKVHGIYAIRSPHRPNHLGLSVVKIKRIEKNRLFFSEVDMIDGTPLIDIKPYVRYFDCREKAISGWLEPHFKDGKIPDRTIV
jgi:tRNA-Thr(GGU) m(6)t(6)A37 methyltransferase TsaA